MNVLMVIKSLDLSSYGGIQSHVWELSQAMIEKGHRVTILTGSPVARHLKTREIAGRIIVELARAPFHRLPFLTDLLDEGYFNKQVMAWVEAHGSDYDVIHLHGRSGLWIPWKKPELASKCVWTVHGLTLKEWQYNGSHTTQGSHTAFSHFLERKASRRVHAVIAVSEDIKQQLIDTHHTRASAISVIPNGILPGIPSTVRSQELIGYAGRMVPLKGVGIFPELLERLDPRMSLIMMGKGASFKRTQQAFVRRNLQDRVIWTGQIPQHQVMDWLRKIRLLIVPSLYEPQGRVVLEAMSVECPVLASNVGGLSEMISHRNNGCLMNPNDPEDLHRQVQWMLDHPAQTAEIAHRGWLSSKQTYGWDGLCDQIIHLYKGAASYTASIALNSAIA